MGPAAREGADDARAGPGARGTLVAVVGPSGAGKDTLIAAAGAALAADPAFEFVRRLVTRPSTEHEPHGSLTEAEFAAGVAAGLYPLWWRAHGLGYALPPGLDGRVAAGAVAVCNLSRAALDDARARFAAVRVVLVTARPSVIAARLAARGRESRHEIERRLARAAAEPEADLTILNEGRVEDVAAILIGDLRSLRGHGAAGEARPAAPRR